MTAGAAAAPSTLLGERGIDALRLARLLIRYRLRFLWNGVRARGRGRFPTLVVIVGLFTSFSYVGLFAQAFGVICARTDVAGQVTALAVVALTIAFGSFTAKAASSEAVLAGSPENEFLLARPVALPTLVVARCLAESATDPLGALFLLPVLLAATLTWDLPRWAVAMAALVSMLVQLGIAGLAQATQISVVRFVPRARRRAAWMALRLLAALSLAALWMMGTRVLRAPATLATSLPPLGPYVSRSPGALIVAPFAALLRGSPSGALVALAALAAATSAAVWLAARVARFAGMQGWEEAGATWADAAVRPRAANARPLTAATKDLALITRDRAQLLALVAMPIIFVGVQLFGALGWKWSTASLERISYLSFSLSLYMATIGPLAHMQAERRAFWILRTVPVSVGRLLAAKARAWSIVVGALALAVYSFLSLGAPRASVGAWLGTAFIVVTGGVGMTWLAIALAAGAADLSDDQRPAIGPGTIYTFLFVGGLYNVVLAGDLAARVRGFVLYAFAIAAYWQGGVRQATVCLDAEAARERRLTLGDGATFLIALALGQRATAALITYAGDLGAFDVPAINLGIALLVGLSVAIYLGRRPKAIAYGGRLRAVAIALAAGLVAGGLARAQGFPGVPGVGGLRAPRAWAWLLLLPLAEELLFRGVIQRGVAELLEPRPDDAAAPSRHRRAALVSAAVSVVLALVAGGGVGAAPLGILLAMNAAAALTRATTGRVSAAFLTRVVATTLAVALTR
ncbi:MAG TPA: CPBP family glutamic-type intramembrane protease [Polyangia bacterium]|nr:CPBP family glutamic-type intramembrane protease [Polyangia bacterium]